VQSEDAGQSVAASPPPLLLPLELPLELPLLLPLELPELLLLAAPSPHEDTSPAVHLPIALVQADWNVLALPVEA